MAVMALLWARVGLMDRRAAARRRAGKTSLFEPHRREAFSRAFARFNWALAATVFVWICVDPVWLPQKLGAINVVFLGVGLIIPVLAAVAHQARAIRLPVLGCLFLLAVAWSWGGRWLGDNHAVGRRAFGGGLDQTAVAGREDFKSAFTTWWDAAPPTADGVKPMVVVAAEGGASRAGFWAAETLGRLQELSNGDFANHVFAISSVSGGSVGSAAFVSQVHENLAPREGFRAATRDAAGGDYLSPVLAGLLQLSWDVALDASAKADLADFARRL
jgi:hypothetical protein